MRCVGWRYQRRKRILPGLTLNVSKRGAGASVGPRGLTATLSLLGTGLAYVWRKRR